MSTKQKKLESAIEEVYLCMNCCKTFKENPSSCHHKNGEVSTFTNKNSPWFSVYDKTSKAWTRSKGDYIGNYIFKFEEKFYTSLEHLLNFSGDSPHVELEKAGFPEFYSIKEGYAGIEQDELAERCIAKLNNAGKPYILYTVTGFPGYFHYVFVSKKEDLEHFRNITNEFKNELSEIDRARIKGVKGEVKEITTYLGWSGPPTIILKIDHPEVKKIETHCVYRINRGEIIEAFTKDTELKRKLSHPFRFIIYNSKGEKQFEYFNQTNSLF
ncbi:hypothetical protein HZA97_02625 [Candidatus Woesearchaeota archaeon]|nr:hypothetical protein [Candidatus Woesearchaeota archaeon]